MKGNPMSGCILCGIDDLSGARQAAPVASRLARDLHSHALLVRVIDSVGMFPRGWRPPPLGKRRMLRKQLRGVLEEHCFPDGTAMRVETGDPATRLIAVAEKEDSELIVVAARRGRNGAVLLVGVASALLLRSPCPVVVVPPRAAPPLDSASMQGVVCGLEGDGSERDLAVLRLAGDLAARLGGEVHAVHGYDPGALPAEARGPQHRLKDVLDEAGVEAQGSVVPLPAAEALQREATKQRSGLVVVGSQGGDSVGSPLQGAVVVRLAAEGSTTLVVLPRAAKLKKGSGHYELAARVA